MAPRTVTALFDTYEAAAEAVDRVEAQGIPSNDVSIVASNVDDQHSARVAASVSDHYASGAETEGAGAGATVGTVLGGGAGLLAGLGLIAIPGVGPVVAAGWLVAAVTGAGVGAATGGLLGVLTGAGLSDADAQAYAEGVRRGGTLLTVRVDDATADAAIDTLKRAGSIDIDVRARDWQAQGWTGGASSAVQHDAPSPAVAVEPGRTADVVPDPDASPATKRPPDAIR